MAADFTALETKVAALEGTVPSAVALLDGIEGFIREAVDADNLADNSATALLADKLGAQHDALAAAVARKGTPPA